MANKPSLYPVFMKNEVFPADTAVICIGPEDVEVENKMIDVEVASAPIDVEVASPVIDVEVSSPVIDVEVE